MIIRTDSTTTTVGSPSQTAAGGNVDSANLTIFGPGGPPSGGVTRTNAKSVLVPVGITHYTAPPLYSSGMAHGLSERTAAGVTLDDPYAYSLNREHAAQAADKDLAQTGTTGSVQVQTADADAVKLQIRNGQLWPDDKLAALGDRMVSAGLVSGTPTREKIEKAWDDLVDKAGARYAANPDSALTPEDMITLYGGGGASGVNGPEGISTKTTVDRRTVLSSNDDARKVIGQLMRTALGRRPTDKEVDDFQVALNDAQRKNTEVNTTTSAPGGNTSTITGGDLDPNSYAAQYVDKDQSLMKEYAHYQAATTLTNWAMQALRGPVGQ